MTCCDRYAFVVHVRGAEDGRPLWGCRVCNRRWTEGNPYAGAGEPDRLMCLSSFHRWKAHVGLSSPSVG